MSADAAAWIGDVVREPCPNAVLCIDPFHVVAWGTEALDEVRRGVWNASRKAGERDTAKVVKGARFALLKNPENPTDRQKVRLSALETLNKPLYRAYLIKEMLRLVFATKGEEGIKLLHTLIAWAQRCRIPAFVKLAARIRRHRDGIEAALTHRVSNGRVEATNNQIRLLTKLAHGFHSPTALIALVSLELGGLAIDLPGRPSLG